MNSRHIRSGTAGICARLLCLLLAGLAAAAL